MPCRWHSVFPRHSFRSGIGKLHSSNRIVTVQFAEGLMKYFLSWQKGKALRFALNRKFWISNYYFIKNFQRKHLCFLLVSNVVDKEHVRISCVTNNNMQKKFRASSSQLINLKRFSRFRFPIKRDHCGYIYRYVEAADYQNTTGAKRTYSHNCQLKGYDTMKTDIDTAIEFLSH